MKRNSPETTRVSGLFLRLRIENRRISNDRLTALTAYRPFRPRQHSPKTAPPTMSAAPMICSGDMVSRRIKTAEYGSFTKAAEVLPEGHPLAVKKFIEYLPLRDG